MAKLNVFQPQMSTSEDTDQKEKKSAAGEVGNSVKKVNNFKYWLNAFATKMGRKFVQGEFRQVFARLEKARQTEALTTPIDLLETVVHNDVWGAFEEWTSCPIHLRNKPKVSIKPFFFKN